MTEQTRINEGSDASSRFTIVGIGASAGGLEALQEFFSHVSPDFPAAYFVVQHLSPDFDSQMADLLGRKVNLPMETVRDGARIQPGVVYLMPPRVEMIITAGKVSLAPVDKNDHLSLPIDIFLTSLAQDAGADAVAVVLSGTGTDGSRGVRKIKSAGGFVLCQTKDSAKFPGMPDAAMATGSVDLRLPPAAMPRAIENWQRGHPIPTEPDPKQDEGRYDDYDPSTKRILDQVRKRYLIDFNHYSPSMILRRIQRRMGLENIHDIDEYIESLERNPESVASLYHDLLIGVSSFFRDPEAFESLRQHAIVPIVNRGGTDEEIRVWVEGCASGEEAYTIAILFLEEMNRLDRFKSLKIFATDAHRESLDIASKGVYSAEKMQAVPISARNRYFEKVPEGYRVREQLRAPIVFAPHNALSSPPFTRMDLVSCRNMLIYFKPLSKKKALSLFHFGLKRESFLFLGSSEAPNGFEDDFETLDKKAKIYRKRAQSRMSPLPPGVAFGGITTTKPTPPTSLGWDQRVSQSHLLRTYETLLDRFVPPSILVDSNNAVLHSFGGAEQLMRLPPGRALVRLPDCLLPGLREAASGLLRRAQNAENPVGLKGVRVEESNLEARVFNLVAEPLRDKRTQSVRVLLCFHEVTEQDVSQGPEPESMELTQTAHSNEQIKYLEDELSSTQENLHAAIEELEASNEELQATNEELVASNEELQSTNEELQSVNEELHTVNAEHQQKIAELSEVTSDLENLIAASQIGVLFLDSDLRLKRFTPLVARLFHLMPSDLGRPLENFKSALDYPDLMVDLRAAAHEREAIERQAQSSDGEHYFVRLMPFFRGETLDGIIGTFINVTSIKQTEQEILKLSALVEQSEDAIMIVSTAGEVQFWNRGAQIIFGYAASEAVGRKLAELIAPDGQAEKEILSFLRKIEMGASIAPFEAKHRAKDGSTVTVSIRVSPIHDADGELLGASVIDRDITQLNATRDALSEREANNRLILNSAAEGILRVDSEGVCIFANRSSLPILGLDAAVVLEGKKLEEIFGPLGAGRGGSPILTKLRKTLKTGHPLLADLSTFERGPDEMATLEVWCRPVDRTHPKAGAVITLLDVTARVKAKQDRDWLSRIIESSSDLICSIDLDGKITFMNPGGRRLCGLKENEDIAGWDLARFHPPESLEQIKSIGFAVARDQGHWHGLTVLRTIEGRELPISQSIFCHNDESGKTYAYSTICRDISDRAAYEGALRKSEDESRQIAAKLSAILSNIPDLLFIVGQDAAIEFASPNTQSFFNAVGSSAALPESLQKQIRNVIDSGAAYAPADYKGVVEFKFGSQTRFLLPRIQPNFPDNARRRATGATVLLQDVTEFRLLDDVKTNLLSTVSHELKTPVTSIRMALLLLLERGDKLDEIQNTLVSTASEETERLLRTLNSLLDLTRFEEGTYELAQDQVDPSVLIDETVGVYRKTMAMNGLQLRTEIEKNLPLVEVDFQRIKHVLSNLISNAIKHSPTNGSILVKASGDGNGSVRFSVEDQGDGIPEKYYSRIFDKFFRMPGNSKPGTGLGLSIAREFIRAHDGSIGVGRSSLGGAAFYFVLKTKKASSPKRRRAAKKATKAATR